jgi:predicted AlkP superfamily phosphohydrolase/phosphomutase
VLLVLFLQSCGDNRDSFEGPGLIILGIDGMDPKFLERHWSDLPSLDRLRREGSFQPLGTTMPPQSPVAWSTVTTGLDPGGHGIFDFVHRDPFTRMPFSSMAETTKAGRTLEIGRFVIPLSSPEVRTHRQGTPFWELLEASGVPATIIRMPANFPPSGEEVVALSGMGTPDLQGTYGTFTFFTDDPEEQTHGVSGGQIVRVRVQRDSVILDVPGPLDTFVQGQPRSVVKLAVYRDPEQPVARFDVGDESFVLRTGEWSRWVRADFPVMDGWSGAAGTFRIFLRSLHPRFELYVSPVNIDPIAPELPIANPVSYSKELAEEIGPFYTQGMAEDTSALRAGALNLDEYIAQAREVQRENHAILRHELAKFRGGLLFLYDSSVDQNGHMLWDKHEDRLLAFYREVDDLIGDAMNGLDEDTTLVVMSDHGFTSFERAVNLNTILYREGFLALKPNAKPGPEELFVNVDWSKTSAYAMGLNGLFINRLGREEGGVIAEGEETQQRIAELRERLTAFRDPVNDQPVIEELYAAGEHYEGYNLEYAPDLLVGYRPPYRASWETPLGGIPPEAVVDNTDAWIGDHCIAPQFVPGVLLSNRRIAVEDPVLADLTVTILRYFGVEPGPEMIGRPLLQP